MGGEDFSYFLNERPGSFFYVGTRNEDRGLVWGHHHPRFDIDEEGLKYGIETMTRVAMRYLNEGV
jgi:amidohydrolase